MKKCEYRMYELVGKEAFVVLSDVSMDEKEGDIICFEHFEDALDHLVKINPDIDGDIKILHGVLTKAEVLPEAIDNLTPYLIIEHPQARNKGFLSKREFEGNRAIEQLANEITFIAKHGNGSPFGKFTKISDVYVLYGYEMSVGLSINDDDIDEERIETAKIVQLEISEIQKDAKKRGQL